MNVRHALAAAAVALSIFGSGSALAAGWYEGYNLTVPKFGGSVTTNNMVKQSAIDPAVVCSDSIGGGYSLYVKVERFDNASRSGWYTINSLTRVAIPYTAAVGQSYHARFSTAYTTVVNVQAQGGWSPDNPGACGF